MEFSLTTKYRNYYELNRFTKNYYVLRGVIRITMNLATIHEFVRINSVTTKYSELLGVARNHSTNGPWIAGQPASRPASWPQPTRPRARQPSARNFAPGDPERRARRALQASSISTPGPRPLSASLSPWEELRISLSPSQHSPSP